MPVCQADPFLAKRGIAMLPEGGAKPLLLAPMLPPLSLDQPDTGWEGGGCHNLAWTAALPPSPHASPESPFWVCPAPGLLAASLERHEAGSSLTGMWHSGHVPSPCAIPGRGGAGGPELPKWLLHEPIVILATSSVLSWPPGCLVKPQ